MDSIIRHIDFVSFFNTYYRAVYFFALKYVKDGEVAEDVIETAFIKVWEKRGLFDSEVGMKSYLYKVVYTGCLKEVRSRKSEVRKKEGLIDCIIFIS